MDPKSAKFGKYLYLGCGNHRLTQFTHVDLNLSKKKRGFPDIFADISKYIPVPDNHVELIFTRGTMEHLKYAELINCFIENYRVLKKGGVVRMLVPDFDIMIDKYINKKKTKVHDTVEFDNWNLYDKMPENGVSEAFVHDVLYHDHMYLHNFDTLSSALKKCGFINIRKAIAGDTIVSEVSSVLKDAEIGRDDYEILIEAQKGDIPPVLKVINKPLPKNFILLILAKFFNIKVSSFVERLAYFPQKRWFAEKLVITYHFFRNIFIKRDLK